MNIAKMKEELRKPKVRKDDEMSVIYGPATSIEDDIGRTVKTSVLPKLAELCKEVEWLYNGQTYGEYKKDKDAKDREKLLKPLENLYNVLQQADKDMIEYLQTLKGNK